MLTRILFRPVRSFTRLPRNQLRRLQVASLDVLRQVENKGRWTVAELDKAAAARGISNKVGDWFLAAWDTAWVLHVRGFHEAKLSSEPVKAREPYVAKLLRRLRNCAKYLKLNITSAHVPFPSSLCPNYPSSLLGRLLGSNCDPYFRILTGTGPSLRSKEEYVFNAILHEGAM